MTQHIVAVITTTAITPFILFSDSQAQPPPVPVVVLQEHVKLTPVVTQQFTQVTQATVNDLQAKLTTTANVSVTLPPDDPASPTQVTTMAF